MKRTVTILMAIAAGHFAIMYAATAVTVSHNLGRSFALSGSPPADTSLTRVASRTSAVFRQPLESFLDMLPARPAPREVTTVEAVLGWFLYALNTILWGGAVCLAWRGIRINFTGNPSPEAGPPTSDGKTVHPDTPCSRSII